MSLWNPSGSNWDTSRNWGRAPRLAAPALADDITILATGLGVGILPAGSVFFIAGNLYSLTADATIVAGNASLAIDPPLVADAISGAVITDYNVLATDADLTQQDSISVGLAKKTTDPVSGKSAYDGKRALVKRDIGAWLAKREFSTSGVLFPWQFNRAATLLELAYIYQDLSRRNEGIPNEKARMFQEMYQTEIESLKFDYQSPATGTVDENTQVRTTANLWRA